VNTEDELSVKSFNTMNEWVKVDTSEINKEVPKDVQGVSVRVSFSPYDVPRQWRWCRDTDSDFLIIEFKYLTEEETRTARSSPEAPIELEIGENSQRIYKIKMNVGKIGADCNHVNLEIEPLARNAVDAIKQFSATVPLKLRERYEMPEKIVFNNRNTIFSHILPEGVH
jgi:hypothetical protein